MPLSPERVTPVCPKCLAGRFVACATLLSSEHRRDDEHSGARRIQCFVERIVETSASVSGLAATAESPRPDDQAQADHEQDAAEPCIASVAAHRRTVYDVRPLSDEQGADKEDQDAESAECPAHHHELFTRSDRRRIQGRCELAWVSARRCPPAREFNLSRVG
jgi:hypothetical protein